jgi:hypothetical protein
MRVDEVAGKKDRLLVGYQGETMDRISEKPSVYKSKASEGYKARARHFISRAVVCRCEPKGGVYGLVDMDSNVFNWVCLWIFGRQTRKRQVSIYLQQA